MTVNGQRRIGEKNADIFIHWTNKLLTITMNENDVPPWTFCGVDLATE